MESKWPYTNPCIGIKCTYSTFQPLVPSLSLQLLFFPFLPPFLVSLYWVSRLWKAISLSPKSYALSNKRKDPWWPQEWLCARIKDPIFRFVTVIEERGDKNCALPQTQHRYKMMSLRRPVSLWDTRFQLNISIFVVPRRKKKAAKVL